jgi:pSer/pThr/pTyr-binding forkhead associated (FHA) protein
MDFELQVVKGRSAAQALKLADGVTTVGRQDECQVRIKSSQVSRKHCELFEKKGMLLVKDLGSANGTFVNGKKVDGQQVLEPGDELTIGGVKLRVAKVGEAPPVKGVPGKKPSDTAVVDAVPVDASDDEFEIDFDDEPGVEVSLAEDAIPIDIDDEPATAPAPAPAAASPSSKKTAEPEKTSGSKKPSAPSPAPVEPEAHAAEEAIADFLLDIKIDDED